MNEAVMTTKELAEYIKLNEKTVIKLAQEGKLPGVKVSNKWRFYRSAINEHLENSMTKMSDNDLNTIIQTAEHIIPLSRLTNEALFELDLQARNKNDVLEDLAMIADNAGIVSSQSDFAALLKKREVLLSTALGQGVAIPHPRDPQLGMFERPHIIIGRSKAGIQFDAPDRKKTHLFFVICATNVFVHLRLLAKIAKLLHVPGMIERLLVIDDKNEFIKILLEFEKTQIVPLFNEGDHQGSVH